MKIKQLKFYIPQYVDALRKGIKHIWILKKWSDNKIEKPITVHDDIDEFGKYLLYIKESPHTKFNYLKGENKK